MSVVDASVASAVFIADDPFHDVCLAWLLAALDAGDPLRGPTLLLPEVTGAVRRVTGDEGLARATAEELGTGVVWELVPVTVALASRAAEIAATLAVRGADSVYVALAAELGEPLVTVDDQQGDRAAGLVAVVRLRLVLPT